MPSRAFSGVSRQDCTSWFCADGVACHFERCHTFEKLLCLLLIMDFSGNVLTIEPVHVIMNVYFDRVRRQTVGWSVCI